MKKLLAFFTSTMNAVPFRKKITFKGLLNVNNWKPKTQRRGESIDVSLPLLPFIAGILFVITIVGWTAWQAYAPQRALQGLAKDQRQMIEYISEFIELPQEQPTIAVVSEREKLNQPFFENAQNGDQVLVFEQAGKVLLYRPTTKKIINFANVQLPDSSGTVQEFSR